MQVKLHVAADEKTFVAVGSVRKGGGEVSFRSAQDGRKAEITKWTKNGVQRLGLKKSAGLFFLRAMVVSQAYSMSFKDGVKVFGSSAVLPEANAAQFTQEDVDVPEEREGLPLVQLDNMFGRNIGNEDLARVVAVPVVSEDSSPRSLPCSQSTNDSPESMPYA